MKLFAVFFIIGVAYGASMTGNYASYGTADSLSHEDTGYGGGYGGKTCYPTYETKYKEKCEGYEEKVCYTTQKEKCKDVEGKKCKAITSSTHERKCHDVTEMLCSLQESVQYEQVPAELTIQKCHNLKERVCDTVYETELTERDDFKCVKIVNPYCALKEHTVYDQTCKTHVHFDCKAANAKYETQDANAAGSYGGYVEPETKCKRTYENKCYTTPRTVSTEYCEDREEKVCEKMTEMVPVPKEKQNCHDENKKVCELEKISQPKQVKKYVYTTHCQPIPKTVCDNADQMFIRPSCIPSSRKVCSYYPEEKCDNVPKQHCYQVPYQVKKMVCSEAYEKKIKPQVQSEGYSNEDTGYNS